MPIWALAFLRTVQILTLSEVKTLMSVAYWCGGVNRIAIAVLGIIGNVISVYVLSRKKMRNNFKGLLALVDLALFDMAFIVTSMSMGVVMVSDSDIHYRQPLKLKWPLLLVLILTVAISAPWLMLAAAEQKGANFIKKYYYILMFTFYIIMTGVIPFLVLFVLNLRLYMDIRATNLAVALSNRESTDRKRKESQLGRVMLSYVIVFLICNLLRLAVYMYPILTFSNFIKCLQFLPALYAWPVGVACVGHISKVVHTNYLIKVLLSEYFTRMLQGSFIKQ